MAGASKYCAEKFSYPSPSGNITGAMEELASQVRRHNIDLLIPAADKTLLPVMEYRDTFFERIVIPFADYQRILNASDKFNLFKLAWECGVPIPKTVFFERFSEETIELCTGLDYPAIIKPARSTFCENGSQSTAGVSYAYSASHIRDLVREKEFLRKYPFLIQERVVGPGIGYFVLMVDNEPIAEFSHRRIREKPPSGGVSVYSEAVPIRPDVRDYALKLLRKLQWSGIAMVEFKLDRRTNTPLLMEINGRFWGSLQLAIDSGVDFPTLLVNSASNGATSVRRAAGYHENQKWRWLMGDTDNLLLRCIKPKNELSLPEGYPSRARCLANFARAFFEPNVSYDVFKKDDLRPFLFELRAYFADLMRG